MAARRLAAGEKTILEKDDTVGASPPAGEKSNIAPAVPKYVRSSADASCSFLFMFFFILSTRI